MKKIVILTSSILLLLLSGCGTTKNQTNEEAVHITNEELEYEIIIFDIGFNHYLNSIAKPVGFYSEQYLETKNRQYVSIWNSRVYQANFNNDIYENIIDYDNNIHYGMEVNYKLFNYFKFVSYKYGETF